MFDLLLNKDIFPSIENVCKPRNGVDICNGGESYSKTEQHGDSQQPSEDSRSKIKLLPFPLPPPSVSTATIGAGDTVLTGGFVPTFFTPMGGRSPFSSLW